jgi:hypothetical protein
MKTIKLSMSGINIKTAFNTMITKVEQTDRTSIIMVDALPHLEITVDHHDVVEFELKEKTMVRFEPDSEPGFVALTKLDESETAKKSAKVPAKSKAPSSGCSIPGAYGDRFF